MSIHSPLSRTLKLFYSYARRDKRLLDELEKHLSGLRRQGFITTWHNEEIRAGGEREVYLKQHLSLSDIILLLISADFIASDNCYCLEMKQAIEKHRRGEAHVIPIMLRDADTHGLPFSILQFLPTDGKPITKWRDRDHAFALVARALRKLIEEIIARLPSEPAPAELVSTSQAQWKVPYRRNAFFTGRTSLLERLRTAFLAQNVGVCVQSLNGMGGIGKTQIALEYTYRYAQIYQAIFWVDADPQGDLLADFVTIAQFLDLPEKDESDQALVISAILRWFQRHEGWLLIFDNVDDMHSIDALLPKMGQGHVLITTRGQATGNMQASYEVEPMDMQEGIRFLLQRARLDTQQLSPDQLKSEEKAAEEIVRLFDGHPLALDQAGAYVQETGRLLSDYLPLYQRRQAALLSRRVNASTGHADSVMTTFSLAFENIERSHPAAAELLRFCAFLHPDTIPEELLMAGARLFDPAYRAMADDPYELDTALAALRTYSLVKHHSTTKTVSIHRLVQNVLKSGMNEEEQRRWVEAVVRTLAREFPDGEPTSWSLCLRYLPHARVAVHLFETWQMRFVEASHLLNRVGYYLYKRAEYPEAQARYEQALALVEQAEEPLLTAHILSNLGVLHIMLAQFVQAESYLQRALRLREQALEPAHPDLGQNLNDLAGVYHNQGRLAEAEPLYRQALAIQEQALGATDPATARTLNNLALLEYSQQKYAESEELNKRALAAREQQLGAHHVDTAQSMLNLAYAYFRQHNYAEAEPLFQRASTIYEEAYGPEHPQTATALNGLGLLYIAQEREAEAGPLLQRVAAIWENTYGPEHPRFIGLANALATISLAQEQYEEAEPLLWRASQLQEKTAWLEHTDLVPNFRRLAQAYEAQGHYDQAAPLYERVLAIQRRVLGEEHPEVAAAQEDYASFLRRSQGADATHDADEIG